ncbi:MAG: hypothetical protein LBQ54_08150 [Planctomycetaceae bacterium]|nr:hypothetical protein [Planctomycetaceae bacterium]
MIFSQIFLPFRGQRPHVARPEAITRSRCSLGSVPLHRSCLRPRLEKSFHLEAEGKPGCNALALLTGRV